MGATQYCSGGANQLLRDFRRRSIFDFCNTIGGKADIPPQGGYFRWSSIINGVGTGAGISPQERHRGIPARRAVTQKRDVPDQNAIVLNVK